MRFTIRSIGVSLLVMVAAVLLAFMSSTTTMFTLAAATYIAPGLMGFPGTPQTDIDLATPYITGATGAPPPQPIIIVTSSEPIPSPDGIAPGSVIFGYSDAGVAVSSYKQSFDQFWASNGGVPPGVTFVLLGNPNRPNGGGVERVGGGSTPTQTAGAAPGQITTYDITGQYDTISDAPTNPLNLLADANAEAGFTFVHTAYSNENFSQAQLQGTFGDTAYYLIPTYPLPLLMPVNLVPGVGPLLADMLDPPLRVLVESGYDRTINPGVPTSWNYTYFPDPQTLSSNFMLAIPTGWDNLVSDLGGGRPFGTVRPGPYGVGGPPVLVDPPSTPATPTPSPLDTPAPASAVAAVNSSTVADPPPAVASQPPAVASQPAVVASQPAAVANTPLAGNADAGPLTTQATEKPPTPSSHVATNPAPPTITRSIASELESVKNLAASLTAPSVKQVSGGSPTTAGAGGGAQGASTAVGSANRNGSSTR